MKDKYWKLKTFLLEFLGCVCAFPGCYETENLEFHHVKGNPQLTKNGKRGGYLNLLDVKRLIQKDKSLVELRCDKHHKRGGIE